MYVREGSRNTDTLLWIAECLELLARHFFVFKVHTLPERTCLSEAGFSLKTLILRPPPLRLANSARGEYFVIL